MKFKVLNIGAVLFILLINSQILFSQVSHRVVVDQLGNGDFTSLQDAINSVRAFDPAGSTVIYVKKGVYYEKVFIPEYVCNIKIIGENRDKTIITYNDQAKKNNMGTFLTYTLKISGNDIMLENITIQNNAEQVGQAVALHTEGNRIILRNCRLLGNQDTYYAAGENRHIYMDNSYIEGTTDFIFGGATVWFEKCYIYCKRNSYITAASTPKNIQYGFIFNNCNISLADSVNNVYLGRPWRSYAMTLFMNCYLPQGINHNGWGNWGNPENEKTTRYFESNNKGAGSDTNERVDWITILDKNQIKNITRENVLGDFYKNK